jgi:hypothetical protein
MLSEFPGKKLFVYQGKLGKILILFWMQLLRDFFRQKNLRQKIQKNSDFKNSLQREISVYLNAYFFFFKGLKKIKEKK